MQSPLAIGGHFTIECRDATGRLKWSERAKNGVTNAGLTNLLDVYLRQQANSTWYISLIDGSGYTALAAADTASSHAGWSESAAYTAATRPAWGPAAAASQSIANSSVVNFTMNATKTIKGAFLISDSTKSGTTGTLFCTALFSQGDRSVVNTDVIAVTYTCGATSA
jgi:hypothetical protein